MSGASVEPPGRVPRGLPRPPSGRTNETAEVPITFLPPPQQQPVPTVSLGSQGLARRSNIVGTTQVAQSFENNVIAPSRPLQPARRFRDEDASTTFNETYSVSNVPLWIQLLCCLAFLVVIVIFLALAGIMLYPYLTNFAL